MAAVALAFAFDLQLSSARAGTVVTHIAGGANHSLFTKSDGSLWGMGANGNGQLGIGFAPAATNVPQQILPSGVGVVAAGQAHSLFQMGGGLWAMGWNLFGQLGDGTAADHFFPERVFPGSFTVRVSTIAAGGFHSLFGTSGVSVGSDNLWAMGRNDAGQLGDGTTTEHDSVEEVVTSASISAVATGNSHSLFIKSGGGLWVMGWNANGQLGNGTTVNTNRPEQLLSSGVTAIAAGSYHSLFIKSDGSLWAMGTNGSGELGDNTTTEHDAPEQVQFTGVTAIAAGYAHSLFIKSDGSLWGMGDNSFGQLGDGGTNAAYLPERIVASNVVAVAAGYWHSLFITSDGSLWGMGYNGDGELGTGDYADRHTPVLIVAGPPPRPGITAVRLLGTNLNLNGTNGVSGEILHTMMSTNPTQPSGQWLPVATNVLNGNGNFSITATNAVTPGAPRQFYILQAE